MKMSMVFWAVLLLAAVPASGEVRKWTMPDGKVMVGEIRSATVDTVLLVQKSDGRTFTLPMELLKTADRLAVVKYLEKKERAGEEKARSAGLESGAYAENVTGSWEPMKSREGIEFYFFASPELKKGTEYPLVVFLNGKSGAGEEKGGVEAGAKAFASRESYAARPCFVVAPVCPSGKTWAGEAEKLSALVGHVVENLPVDRSRIYAAGSRDGAAVLVREAKVGFAGALVGTGSSKVSGVPVRMGSGAVGEAWLFEQKRKDD